MIMTHVDGVEIVERQPAVAMAGSIAPGAKITAVEELLLADGRTLFHCIHKNAVNCEYTNPVLGGVTSHQRSHSDRMQAKRATEKAEELASQLAEIKAANERKRENYRQGAVKGQETRKARQMQTPSEAGGAGNGMSKPGVPTKSVIGDTELARKAQQVIIAYNALQDAHDQFQNVFLGYMRAAQVASERPAIEPLDPKIIEKAKKYDTLKGMLA